MSEPFDIDLDSLDTKPKDDDNKFDLDFLDSLTPMEGLSPSKRNEDFDIDALDELLGGSNDGGADALNKDTSNGDNDNVKSSSGEAKGTMVDLAFCLFALTM